jgi:hypothetical protein
MSYAFPRTSELSSNPGNFISNWQRLACVFLALLTLLGASFTSAGEALPSWNQGKAKQAIIDFVAAVTDEKSSDYVEPSKRIAVFDNDGTLWVE